SRYLNNPNILITKINTHSAKYSMQYLSVTLPFFSDVIIKYVMCYINISRHLYQGKKG
ncbi:hypothetical protein L9F63_023468, partial [Diploptera punctata]